eukprot:Em0019g647a
MMSVMSWEKDAADRSMSSLSCAGIGGRQSTEGAKVEECVCGAQNTPIRITHEIFKGELVVGAQDAEECSSWKKALQDAGRVNWKNAQVGDTIIHQMEQKTQQVAQEMKQTIDKLNEEASALVQEKEKKAELEALAAKLEAEKRTIEEAAVNLRTEKETTKLELQSTLATISKVQEERDSLEAHIQGLETKAQIMEQQRQKVLAELQEKETQAKELDEEKARLAKTTALLKEDIDSLEGKRKLLEKEKELASLRLGEQMEAARQLEEEKKKMADTAISLQQNLEQVVREKSSSTSKWREEYHRRVKAEQRFQQAEASFKRLDKTLKSIGANVDFQFEVHANNLKRFFEECVAEKQSEENTDEGMLQSPPPPLVTWNGQQLCSDQTLEQEDGDGDCVRASGCVAMSGEGYSEETVQTVEGPLQGDAQRSSPTS